MDKEQRKQLKSSYPEAYSDGRDAGQDLANQAGQCPYKPGTNEHQAWNNGFSEGRASLELDRR